MIYVRGTTIMTFLNIEKKMACFFLFNDLNTFCPIYCKSMNMKAAKYWFKAGTVFLINTGSELKT